MACQSPCEYCTDEVTCLTVYDCDNASSGSYPDASTKTCKKCPYPCLTCSSPGVCHTCDGDLANRKDAPQCTCEAGYYNLIDECIKCPLPCATCSDAETC